MHRICRALRSFSGHLKKISLSTGVLLAFLGGLTTPLSLNSQEKATPESLIPLPEVSLDGDMSVERAMAGRRSMRNFTEEPVSVEDLSQLLWAGQGMTEVIEEPPPTFGNWEWRGGLRTTPSAGALYPLELYVVIGAAEGIDPGLYRYVPLEHGLLQVSDEDLREPLWDAALRQTPIRVAPATMVIAGVFERTEVKYRERAEQYVHMEVGACAENIFLQAGALNLGTVFIGAFIDDRVQTALRLPTDHQALSIMPVGHVPSNWRELRW